MTLKFLGLFIIAVIFWLLVWTVISRIINYIVRHRRGFH